MVTLCKEIVIFLILAKLLESFRVGDKYGKFIKIIIALIVVLKLITPIFSLIDVGFDFEGIVSEIENRIYMRGETYDVLQEEIKPIENIEISGVKIKVEEVQWEK